MSSLMSEPIGESRFPKMAMSPSGSRSPGAMPSCEATSVKSKALDALVVLAAVRMAL
jgi:hypothetical protein